MSCDHQRLIDQQAKKLTAAEERIRQLMEGLGEIVDLKESEYEMPSDWHAQIESCSECQGWAKNHPIQRGICNTHRRPLWARERHDEAETRALGSRAKDIARTALLNTEAKP